VSVLVPVLVSSQRRSEDLFDRRSSTRTFLACRRRQQMEQECHRPVAESSPAEKKPPRLRALREENGGASRNKPFEEFSRHEGHRDASRHDICPAIDERGGQRADVSVEVSFRDKLQGLPSLRPARDVGSGELLGR